MVPQLLGITQRATGESPIENANCQVEAFGVAGVYQGAVWVADLRGALHPFNNRAVEFARGPELARPWGELLAKGFDFRSVINVLFEGVENGSDMANVTGVTIGAELETLAICPGFEFLHKSAAFLVRAFADKVIDNQFGFSVNAQIAVELALVRVASFRELRTAANKAVQFIHLDAFSFDVSDMLVKESLAMLASGIQDV
jgi:hypothetical protein